MTVFQLRPFALQKKPCSQISSWVIFLWHRWFSNFCVCTCDEMLRYMIFHMKKKDFPWPGRFSFYELSDFPFQTWLNWFQVIFFLQVRQCEVIFFLWVRQVSVMRFSKQVLLHFQVCPKKKKKRTAPVDLPGWFHNKSTKTCKWQNLNLADFYRTSMNNQNPQKWLPYMKWLSILVHISWHHACIDKHNLWFH